MAMNQSRIRCAAISYRQGFVEVLPNIHAGLVNLETWRLNPEVDANCKVLADDIVTSNTELEMTVAEAEKLVEMLQAAIRVAVASPRKP
ncbi:hypothetical protein [Uliginosibacterium flavum]|uniref:Uncharacterized protein n=1 Tax=Uliginosibacterium flavum TaxID=1396831 RepID=A0ABV2TI86_9RHOO